MSDCENEKLTVASFKAKMEVLKTLRNKAKQDFKKGNIGQEQLLRLLKENYEESECLLRLANNGWISAP